MPAGLHMPPSTPPDSPVAHSGAAGSELGGRLETWLRDRLLAERERSDEQFRFLLEDFSQELKNEAPTDAVDLTDEHLPNVPPLLALECLDPPRLNDSKLPDRHPEPIVSTTTTSPGRTESEVSRSPKRRSLVPKHASSFVMHCEDEEDDSLYKRFRRKVGSTSFELFFACIIMLNACILALSAQYTGIESGYRVHYPTYTMKAVDAWPLAADAFVILETFFAVIFTVELALRVAAHRFQNFYTIWFHLDVAIVVLAWCAFVLDKMNVNLTVLRLLRIGKVLRVLRLFRSNALLEGLHVLTVSINSSMNMMLGALMVIVLMHVIAGLLIHQLVEPFLRDESQPIELRREVFDYYGTFWRCTITMFEISLANWAPSCRVLLNYVSESFGIFFLIYRCGIGFAVLTVVQAVFIQQTIQSAQRNEEFALWQKRKEQDKQLQALMKAFNNLDESGDGYVTWNEFMPILDATNDLGKEGRALMSLLGVDVKDAESLFKILAAGDDKIDLHEFVTGMQNMNGMAKALDLVALQHSTRRIETKIDRFMLRTASSPTTPAPTTPQAGAFAGAPLLQAAQGVVAGASAPLFKRPPALPPDVPPDGTSPGTASPPEDTNPLLFSVQPAFEEHLR
jgi:hypothetical protein